MSVSGKRLQQAIFEALASSNRAAGSGGGAGLAALPGSGSSQYASNQSTSSTTAVDVTGSSISIPLPRPGSILALATVSAHMQASPTGSSSVVINGNGITSVRMRFPGFGTSESGTCTGYLVLNNLQPGTATFKLQFWADFGTDTITLVDWHMDTFLTLS